MQTVQIAPENTAQAAAWDGEEGAYWARHAERFDASLAHYREGFLAAAAVTADEHVLDVGCGTGQTTRDAARLAPTGSALGLDLSASMLGVARDLAVREGVANARFEQGDAQVHDLPQDSFDVVISRTGASFFADPVAAFGNLARALRPDGRLALLTWQPASQNPWFGAFAQALSGGQVSPPEGPGPFGLAEPSRVKEVLSAGGLTQVKVDPATGPMHFGKDVDSAHAFVLGLLGWMVAPADRARAERALLETLVAHRTADGVCFPSAMWLVTARRDR